MVLDETDSTQTELKKQLNENPNLSHFSFVQAYTQKGGRGRQGRVWESPIGNLYLSVLLQDQYSTWTPHFVANALYEALLEMGVAQARMKIKWPNDIWIDGSKKIAGIICEKVGLKMIAGIGVNVLHTPQNLDRPVISLNEVLHPDTGAETEKLRDDSIIQLRDLLIEHLERSVSLPELKHHYQARMLFQKNTPLSWTEETTQKQFTANFSGMGEHGELCVTFANGEEKKLYSEEVHIYRNST